MRRGCVDIQGSCPTLGVATGRAHSQRQARSRVTALACDTTRKIARRRVDRAIPAAVKITQMAACGVGRVMVCVGQAECWMQLCMFNVLNKRRKCEFSKQPRCPLAKPYCLHYVDSQPASLWLSLPPALRTLPRLLLPSHPATLQYCSCRRGRGTVPSLMSPP